MFVWALSCMLLSVLCWERWTQFENHNYTVQFYIGFDVGLLAVLFEDVTPKYGYSAP